ncbi:MAG: lytic transglycosylase domain-containing protein [Pseudomonadota bacterium]
MRQRQAILRKRWSIPGALGAIALPIALLATQAMATAPDSAPRPTALKATPAMTSAGAEIPEVYRRYLLTRALRSGSASALDDLAALGDARALVDAPLLGDLVEWRRVLDTEGADWEAIDAFDKRRPGWPRMRQLKRSAEWKMPEGTPPERVRLYFSGSEPQTARGMRLYGEALRAAGDTQRGDRWIVRAWREQPAPPAERELFLKKHKTLLREHHPARVEMLMSRQRYDAARRLAAKKLDKDYRALIEARVTLYRTRRGVDAAVKRVPAALQEEQGLTHARAIWRVKKNRHAEAEKLIRQVDRGGAVRNPELWSTLRMTLARDAYEEGRTADAYSIAAPHGLEQGIRFAELEWFAGWMALRFNNAPDVALKHFDALWENVSTPISRSRAAYWAGRAAQQLGDRAKAATWFERAAQYTSAFYGQLAAEQSGLAPNFADTSDKEMLDPATLSAQDRALYDAAGLLYSAGLDRDARRFLLTLADRRDAEADLRRFIALAGVHDDGPTQIALGKVGRAKGRSIWRALYPIPAFPTFTGRTVETALLLGIARQESAFSENALSGAGAKGLMQLMTATARSTARSIGVQFDRNRLTSDAEYNLNLGDAHLEDLLAAYDGSYALTAAAYNAGGGNVSKWIQRFGDPRDPDVDIIDWIESIPFNETRNYVQRVLESVQVYRGRLAGAAAPLSLTADLSK